MKKKHILLAIVAAVLVVLSMMTSLVKSISGKVIDAETGRPVQDAVVLVEWTRRVGIGDYHTVSVRAAESVTSKEGKFWIAGPLHPFTDPESVTVYKKGYVAWNNKFVFPNYQHRKQSHDIYDQIRLEQFNKNYFYKDHADFIGTCISDALASYKKGKFIAAYQWEVDLARQKSIK